MPYRRAAAVHGACPRCTEPLTGYSDVDGVRLCLRCGGVFADNAMTRIIVTTLDRALLGMSLAVRLGKTPVRDDGSGVFCPDCSNVMSKVHVTPAACDVDACVDHGTWFDAGELEEVMRAYAAQRKRGARAPKFALEPLLEDAFGR